MPVSRWFLTMVLAGFVGGVCHAHPGHPPLLVPAPGSPIAVAEASGSLVLGELNQDGKPDLVVATKRGIRVLLGRGDGQFRVAPGDPLPHQATEMLLRDFNGDGRQDLALAHHDSYDVILLFGDGKGGLALAPASPLTMKKGQHPHTHGLLAGDVNGDHHLDIVSVNSTDHDVSIALGDGKGGFTTAAGTFAVGASPYPGALADLDGDGDLDLIATTTERRDSASARALTVLTGDGHGGFRAASVPLRTASPWFVAVADLNGDRKPDLVATHAERSELTVLLGDGKGGFIETTGSPFDLGHAAWHLAVADLNGDGKPDVMAAAGEGVRVMLGDGRGGFTSAPGSPFATGKGTWQLAAGDVNADGRPDVVTSSLDSETVIVLLGR